VFHDDQHGTAIISAAGLINACAITGRRLEDIKLVLCGARAAGIASLELVKAMGVRPDHCIAVDNTGVIWRGRVAGMNQWKSAHAVDTDARTLADAMKGATISNVNKPATLENGVEVQVPSFIETGDTIRVDAQHGDGSAEPLLGARSVRPHPQLEPCEIAAVSGLRGNTPQHSDQRHRGGGQGQGRSRGLERRGVFPLFIALHIGGTGLSSQNFGGTGRPCESLYKW